MSSPQSSPARMPVSPSRFSDGVSDVVATYARGVAKTPAAVRDALDSVQRKQFEAEYRAALLRAADTLDLEPVLTLVQRTWWVRAVICLNPEILDGVADDAKRVAAGDESVFPDGSR